MRFILDFSKNESKQAKEMGARFDYYKGYWYYDGYRLPDCLRQWYLFNPLITSKHEILIRRGFSNAEIVSGLAILPHDWLIKTISKKELVASAPKERISLEELYYKLFSKDSVEIGPFCGRCYEQSFFEYVAKVPDRVVVPPVATLEPFIARLVRALNGIGVYTSMSCDGWHERNEYKAMKLWMYDRYSVLWMWVIMEFVFGESWVHSKSTYHSTWKNIWEPDDKNDNYSYGYTLPESHMICSMRKGEELEVYERNNKYAAFIERYNKHFKDIRKEWICKLEIEHPDVDEINFMALRRIFLGYMEQDLKKMSVLYKKFK